MRLARFAPRFRAAYRAVDRLASRERWSRDAIAAWQLERLNALWREATLHVPYYRELRLRRGLPARFSSLAEFRTMVPILSTQRVREDPTAFLSERAGRGCWDTTSGSTGATLEVFWPTQAHRESLWHKYRLYQSWGVDIFDRTVFVWGHDPALLAGLRRQMARCRRPAGDWFRNRVRLSAYFLSPDRLRGYLRTIERARPRAIYTYSSVAYLLARAAEETGFRCDSLRAVFVTSEPAYPYMVEAIERVFEVPAVIEYGSVECGVIAGQRRDRTLRVFDDAFICETVPRQEDARFDIVVTPFANAAFPWIRYAIGDVTDAPLERPARGFGILANVAGRSNDVVLTRSGRRLSPFFFEGVFREVEGVRRYRVHQQESGAVSVAVEPIGPRVSLDSASFEQTIESYLEGYSATVAVVDEIPTTASGKHRWVVSEMA